MRTETGKELKGEQLEAELLKYAEMVKNKERVQYLNHTPSVDQIINDLNGSNEVVVKLGDDIVLRVTKQEQVELATYDNKGGELKERIISGVTKWRIYVNDSSINITGSSMKNEEVRREEIFYHDTKTDDIIRPSTVRNTGESLLRRTLDQIMSY